MARDISIAISAKDNYTSTITKIRGAQTAFRKDTEELQRELNTLNGTKVNLKVDLSKAKLELKNAEKAFGATASEANRLQLKAAEANYENIKSNLDSVSKAARSTEKDISSLGKEVSKSENRAGIGASVQNGIISRAMQAGAAKMVGDVAANVAQTAIGSAFGSTGATLFGNALSSAASGAALGTMIAPGIGTAVGGAIGAGLGIVNGATQIYQEKDDSFKGYVQEQYGTVKQKQAEDLSNGSGIAANRETALMSFTTMFGREETAKAYLEKLQKMADVTPFSIDDLTSISKTLKTFGYNENELIPQITKVGDAGAALGMNTADMTMVSTAIGRMKSSGKASLEYINILQERGIDAVGYLADEYGVSKGKIYEKISKGLIPGEKAAKAISDHMGKAYENAMQLQSTSFSGMMSTLEGYNDNLNAAMGEGYNEKRKEGIQKQADFLGGPTGEKIKEAQKAIGAWQASLDNAYDEALRNAQQKMMDSQEYKDAKSSGNYAEMGKLMAQAQVQGMNEYKASEGYQLQLKSDLDLASGIRNDATVQSSYWDSGYQMGKEFSKGIAAGTRENRPELGYMYTGPASLKTGFKKAFGMPYVPYNDFPAMLHEGERVLTASEAREYKSVMSARGFLSYAPKKAYGMQYVPYDNFPAMLHEGEKVLTASEARSNKETPQILITGNNFTVREDADIDKIAQELVSKIKTAWMVSAGG